MKLFIYEHCPFCIKARMIFGLTKTPVELIYLANDDEETPIKMIGAKMVPILEKDDGTFMPESMDIVHYINDMQKHSVFKTEPTEEIANWIKETFPIMHKLVMPRNVLCDFEEFKTQSSKDYYQHKKEDYIGPFADAMAKTPEYSQQIKEKLNELADLMKSEQSIHAELSEDDIHVFAILRGLTLVKGLEFPNKVQAYMESMAKQSNIPLAFNFAV